MFFWNNFSFPTIKFGGWHHFQPVDPLPKGTGSQREGTRYSSKPSFFQGQDMVFLLKNQPHPTLSTFYLSKIVVQNWEVSIKTQPKKLSSTSHTSTTKLHIDTPFILMGNGWVGGPYNHIHPHSTSHIHPPNLPPNLPPPNHWDWASPRPPNARVAPRRGSAKLGRPTVTTTLARPRAATSAQLLRWGIEWQCMVAIQPVIFCWRRWTLKMGFCLLEGDIN